MIKVITVDTELKTVSVDLDSKEVSTFGVALCHPNDQFDEKYGIKLATARAEIPFDLTVLSNITQDCMEDDLDLNDKGVSTLIEATIKKLAKNIKIVNDAKQR